MVASILINVNIFEDLKSCYTKLNILKSFQDWIHAVDHGYGVDMCTLQESHKLSFAS